MQQIFKYFDLIEWPFFAPLSIVCVEYLNKIEIKFIDDFIIRFRHFLRIMYYYENNELFELVKNEYSLQHWYMAYKYAVKTDDQSILPGISSKEHVYCFNSCYNINHFDWNCNRTWFVLLFVVLSFCTNKKNQIVLSCTVYIILRIICQNQSVLISSLF